jgi:hypothetical protein
MVYLRRRQTRQKQASEIKQIICSNAICTTDLGGFIVPGKRSLLKFISFYQLPRTEIIFRKCILFFRKPMNRTCRFVFAFRGSTGAGDRFAWTLELRRPDAKIRAEIPLLTEQDER